MGKKRRLLEFRNKLAQAEAERVHCVLVLEGEETLRKKEEEAVETLRFGLQTLNEEKKQIETL